jgi:hypothetical protein
MIRGRQEQQGSTLILTLAFLALMIVPMLAILNMTGRMSTASVTANGLASSSANAAATRFIDLPATRDQGQPQLFSNSPEVTTAAGEVTTATQEAWRMSSAGGTGATLDMLPAASPSDPGSSSVVGVFNLPDSPADNYSTTQSANTGSNTGCSTASGFSGGVLKDGDGNIICWVDALAKNKSGVPTRTPIWNNSWDHYSSGAEVLLQLKFQPFSGISILSQYPGVASFSQLCKNDSGQAGSCYQ